MEGPRGHSCCWQVLEELRGLPPPPPMAPAPAGPYLQLQPGGGLCAHPVGIGASQAFLTEGPVASRPFTDEVQQILVGEEGKRRKTLRMGAIFHFLPRQILIIIILIVTK